MPVPNIPGLSDLWAETKGSPQICIAVLDGPVDLSHPSFDGAALTPLEYSKPNTEGAACRHGTHVASIIFGQHHTEVKGIAPGCSGVLIPVFHDHHSGKVAPCTQETLADSIFTAIQHGAHLINISGGQLLPTECVIEHNRPGCGPHPKLREAITACAQRGIVVIAAAGNDGCECLHIPGAIPSVLVVGATTSDGGPHESSNWGGVYNDQGVVAPGEEVLGAVPGSRYEVRNGTSFATPIVSGLIGLLLSRHVAQGNSVNAKYIRRAVLETAVGCRHSDQNPEVNRAADTSTCERLLAGRISIPDVLAFLDDKGATPMNDSEQPTIDDTSSDSTPEEPRTSMRDYNSATDPLKEHTVRSSHADVPAFGSNDSRDRAVERQGLIPAACGCGTGQRSHVYVIGNLTYDFETYAREDSVGAALQSPNLLRGYRTNVRNTIDLLRHVRGYKEVEVKGRRNSVASVESIDRFTLVLNLEEGTGRAGDITAPSNTEIDPVDEGRVIYISGVKPTASAIAPVDGINGWHFIKKVDIQSGADKVTLSRIGNNGPVDPGHDYIGKKSDIDVSDAEWYLPYSCKIVAEHPPHEDVASEVTWILTRDLSCPLYALRPAGSFSESGFVELTDFALGQLGLTAAGLNLYRLELPEYGQKPEPLRFEFSPTFLEADPCYNDKEFCPNWECENIDPLLLRDETAEHIAIAGYLGGMTTIANGTELPVIDPVQRGTSTWSIDRLVDAIGEVQQSDTADGKDVSLEQQQLATLLGARSAVTTSAVRQTTTRFVLRLSEEARNLGIEPQHRAVNFVATQVILISRALTKKLRDLIALQNAFVEAVSVESSDLVCRNGSQPWEVQIVMSEAVPAVFSRRVIVAFTVDVGDVVPVILGELRVYPTR